MALAKTPHLMTNMVMVRTFVGVRALNTRGLRVIKINVWGL
ncbi:hypothetical protein Ark11_1113 [Candidatus Ichthyocystis hellenicum]|uniref:Uncharacterized protein n=1 Tax=Candidatus Ichthyocystis hellenicum TaxID=1561003 RepID=A0A0S4M6M7_9BURK|nr:hypothetical protein Ark11_1113 [Candidatus Ichthyocystis hellenicum]